MRRRLIHIASALCLILSVSPSYAFIVDPSKGPSCVIVIDPGHGGEDAGAKGPGGMEEKYITLNMAIKAAAIINGRGACRALLTRSADVFVPLEERTEFANRNGADIFVSIHANAALSRDAGGIETFFLSIESTDEDAMRVAEFENSVSSLEDPSSGDGPDGLVDIISDLAETAAHHESSVLAEAVQTSLVQKTGWEDRGVKQAPFVVLAGAVMPAVLVEVGFISNPSEERRLASEEAHERIIGSLVEGIFNFRRMSAGGRGFRNYVGLGQGAKKD